ncbi:AraC family transcriptional regulator [Aquimarina sp. AU58]|uniref:helix-turn-helix domain-containing protein n=1 Tax=Aquimarina sp. AU58 TaxID=1874112 RepID=UPI000D6E37B0|nr:AraC family transcriptional regulator [Aquimarina sp. AU58]
MLCTQFPDPNASTGSFYNNLWEQNILLQAKSKSIAYIDKKGPLSLKATLKGSERYIIDKVPIEVNPESILIINENHSYSSIIDSDCEVDSLSIYFKKDLDKQVFAGLIKEESFLLSNPDYTLVNMSFYEFRQNRSKLLKQLFTRLLSQLSEPSSIFLIDEIHISIVEELIRLNYGIYTQANSLKYRKKSTRLEIFKRINLVKEYLHCSYGEDVNLSHLSKIACMSEYHFLRCFKETMGNTPHKYLIELRLQKAFELLKSEAFSVPEISDIVGFKDVKYFKRIVQNKSMFKHALCKIKY